MTHTRRPFAVIKRLRIAALLYLLALIAANEWLTSWRSTDWDQPLWIDVYPINGDGSLASDRFIGGLEAADLKGIEQFLAQEAKRYGQAVDPPFRLSLAPPLSAALPPLPQEASALGALVWSLKMRWLGAKLRWHSSRPATDALVLAVFHSEPPDLSLERSVALRKGMLVVANLFAADAAKASNNFVLAHELLHLVGATDKYDPVTAIPSFPGGYAAPNATPRYPQTKTEIMGGRRPLSETSAEIPAGLQQAVVGPDTAAEIRWIQGH